MSLSIIASIVAHPEHRETVRQALSAMLTPTRAEAGCRQYDLHVDQADPNRMVMIERWTDDAALDAHVATPHMAQLKAIIGDKTAGIDIQRLNHIA
ncbi:putative quinol monooxygenase [Accumulibacter sp.]|uniref:putative quinol monooxygenase n=1 Tax=Accumulibacter sp. TaxID=2053492 RepID=UPI0026154A8A|nr:putative quinol monooxygenase [Accumulibacter sp.]